jgi:hypothetical protein
VIIDWVFEVMTQVDQGLTKSIGLAQPLVLMTLNKNLGCHRFGDDVSSCILPS